VFWEVMLVPMYFLIGIWGGRARLYAAIKFFLYTLVGSVVMLLGILALYFRSKSLPESRPPAPSTHGLAAHGRPADLQFWVFLAFFVGFAIKVPMFPFHTWLPDAHVEAPTAGSVILAGVLLKMGTYGFVRFSLPLLPQATLDACRGWRRSRSSASSTRAGDARAEGHEEAGRLLLGQPPRLRACSACSR
jgi:NADH-quinone oxidoreductase subunit M